MYLKIKEVLFSEYACIKQKQEKSDTPISKLERRGKAVVEK